MVGELQPGDPQSAGPYNLIGRLGGGGMGRVYLGRSPGGRLVAVKVIRPELAEDQGFRVRFAREVAAARNVSGMFTALVVDADTDGPMPWLATAYVDGPTLAEAVAGQGPLPAASVLALAAGLAEGLAAIHAAGVVHRDLKPSNVLLAPDGPRVIDFGISRAAEATMLTQPGMVLGSPGFMSPEQVEGNEVGPPSDIFSLGAVLLFAATAEAPFGTGPTPALLYRVVHSEPDVSAAPEQVQSLIRRCLAKSPADRPTASDLLAELGGGQFVPGWLPASLAEALGQRGAGQPLAADTQSMAGLSARQSATDPGGDGTPGQASHRNRRRVLIGLAAALVVVAGSATAAVAFSGQGGSRKPAATSAFSAPAPARVNAAASTAISPEPTPPERHSATPSPKVSSPSPTASRPTSAPPSGAGIGKVPAVLGETLSSSASALKKVGFDNIPYLYGCYDSPNYGDVVRQDPAPGTTIALTAPVRIYLQANNCHVVPDVIGLTLSSAESQLGQAGFSDIQYMYGCYGSSSVDDVVKQSPGHGSSYGSTQPIAIDLQKAGC